MIFNSVGYLEFPQHWLLIYGFLESWDTCWKTVILLLLLALSVMQLPFLSGYGEPFVVFQLQLHSQTKVYLYRNHHRKDSRPLPDLPENLFTSNIHCTGFFEMIVGVVTTCHTQYTWDRSICILYLIEQHSKFLLHTLQVLYMCTLCDSTNINVIIEFVPNCL